MLDSEFEAIALMLGESRYCPPDIGFCRSRQGEDKHTVKHKGCDTHTCWLRFFQQVNRGMGAVPDGE